MERKKTLGFTATGRVVQHLAEFIAGSKGNTDTDQSLRCDFFNQFGQINVWYDTKRYKDKRQFDWEVKGKLESSLQETHHRLEVKSFPTFSELFNNSDIIVDTSADFGFSYGSDLATHPYIEALLGEHQKNKGERNIDALLETLYEQYYARHADEFTGRGKIPLSKEDFDERMKLASQALEIIGELENPASYGATFGRRTKILLPFYMKMITERAQELRGVSSTGRMEQELPVYIVVTNEPCMISTLYSSAAPRLRERMVACSGVDQQRVLEILCQDVLKKEEKEKLNISSVNSIPFSVRGIHGTGMAYPAIQEEWLNGDVGRNFAGGQLIQYLQRALDLYYNQHRDDDIVYQQLGRSILQIATNAGKSMRKELSRFPGDSFLCDGYYHRQGPAAGLFLSGEYSLRNGFVVPREPYQGNDEKLIRTIGANRTLLWRLLEGPLKELQILERK